MIQTEFIKEYCKNSNIEEEKLNKLGMFAFPCKCSDVSCKGWTMITKNNLQSQIDLYI